MRRQAWQLRATWALTNHIIAVTQEGVGRAARESLIVHYNAGLTSLLNSALPGSTWLDHGGTLYLRTTKPLTLPSMSSSLYSMPSFIQGQQRKLYVALSIFAVEET